MKFNLSLQSFKIYTLVFIITVSCYLVGCKKLISVKQPANQLVSDLVFSSDQSAQSAVAGLYSTIVSSTSFLNGSTTLYAGMAADELTNTYPGTNDQFVSNSLLPSNGNLQSDFWAPGYRFIYTTNAILEGLNKSTGISTGTKNSLRGEMLFIRSLCYFYLVNIFGDVPLITTTSYTDNQVQARTSSATVYQQIITDLLESQNLLSADYPSADRVRPNKYAVTALLSRSYLYTNNFVQAETNASAVIGSGSYSLESNLNNIFLAGSNEAIWQLQTNSATVNTNEGDLLIPGGGTVPRFSLTSNLLQSFETGDNRLTAWAQSITVGGNTYFYPFKYKVKTSTTIYEHYMMLRLGEQYLIRAESRLAQNKLPEALADLNVVRNRAGLSNSSAMDATTLKLAIEQERRIELFAEWGHRWLDLKRTQRADKVLSAEKGSVWQATDILFPIPQSQIDLNTALTQNPGY